MPALPSVKWAQKTLSLETELPELEADIFELKNTLQCNSISVFIFIDWCLTILSVVVTIFTAYSNINVSLRVFMYVSYNSREK